MGIKGLLKFLRDKFPESIHNSINILSILFGKKSLWDMSGFIYKYKAAAEDRWMANIVNLFSLIYFFELNGASLVFDGKAPTEKGKTLDDRKQYSIENIKKAKQLEEDLEKFMTLDEISDLLKEEMTKIKELSLSKRTNLKNNVKKKPIEIDIKKIEKRINIIKNRSNCKPTSEDIIDIKKLADLFGIPWYQASGEAETFCAQMCKEGLAEVVVTEDMDILAYGCVPICVSKLDFTTDTCQVIITDDLLKHMKFTKKQMMEFCILCGNDYNKNAYKFGPAAAYKNMVKYGSIEKVRDDLFLKEEKFDWTCYKDYKKTRDIFNLSVKHLAMTSLEEEKHKEILHLKIWENKKDTEAIIEYLETNDILYWKKSIERCMTSGVKEREIVLKD